MHNTEATLQLYRIESCAKPGAHLEQRAYYKFTRRLILEAFEEWADERRFDVLIDIGSSTGILTKQLKRHANVAIAVDFDDRVLNAIGDPEIVTIQDSLPDLLLLKSASADLVICTDTLYYFSEEELTVAFRRIAEILRPGGFLLFNDNGTVDELVKQAETLYRKVAVLQSPVSLKSSPNFDRLYWQVEYRYHTCRGVFLALKESHFDPARDIPELQKRALVQFCLRNRWLEHFLWMFWPLRQLARVAWASPALLRWFCVKHEPHDCLWVYQKRDSC